MAGKNIFIFYLSSFLLICVFGVPTTTISTVPTASIAGDLLQFPSPLLYRPHSSTAKPDLQQKQRLDPRTETSKLPSIINNEVVATLGTSTILSADIPPPSRVVIVGHRKPVPQIFSEELTIGGGNTGNSTIIDIATVTATRTQPIKPPLPKNTQPCNQYLEFCNRSYGNITHVAAHNSPFVQKKSAAANQHLDVKAQLDDGIRMLQGQTHLRNGMLHFCHTSCDLLDAGPVEGYLRVLTQWLKQNPFEVVTVLLTNGDYISVEEFREPLRRSGITDMAYIPPSNASTRYDSWPTLGELIIKSKRVVMFLDYKANTTQVPWLLPQYDYMYETPFSPTDRNFPCNIQRPPNKEGLEDRMYLVNHNLNANLQLLGHSVLVPDKVDINITNADTGHGSLGDHARLCTKMWQRAPNFLLVDFYEAGNGSVFKVAAEANGVEFRPENCCKSQNFAGRKQASNFAIAATVVVWSWMILFM